MLAYDSALFPDIPLVDHSDTVGILSQVNCGVPGIAAAIIEDRNCRSRSDVRVALDSSAGPPLGCTRSSGRSSDQSYTLSGADRTLPNPLLWIVSHISTLGRCFIGMAV